MITKIKGTQDFIDLRLFNGIISLVRKHLTLYHFTEIETPIIEPTELFKRSLGTETDVVNKEMFLISSEKEPGSMCLRPELTAPTVRAFIENGIQTVPWKVFTWGPCFRYERPQKGRFRQFHQVSMEVVGSASIAQDAQFIKMLDRLFHEQFKLNNYVLQINFLGCPQDRAAHREELKKFLTGSISSSLCETCLERREKNIMRVFDCKNEQCQNAYLKAPKILDHLCAPCEQEWQQLQQQLELLSVSCIIKPTLVRGLDYYNKTVFEFVSDNLGAQSTFCGGGRYDQLISQLGGKEDQPSVGAACGIERLMLLLEPTQDTLMLPPLPPLTVIIPMDKAQENLALLIADDLQAQGICVEPLLDGGSMKSMMRKANKEGAAYCIILGEQEQTDKTATVKNMITGQEQVVAQTAIAGVVKK